MTVQVGLCRTWLEYQIVGFLVQRLKCKGGWINIKHRKNIVHSLAYIVGFKHDGLSNSVVLVASL